MIANIAILVIKYQNAIADITILVIEYQNAIANITILVIEYQNAIANITILVIECLILIQVDTFISNNKMCFDYGKEEASSKNK